MTKQEEQKRAIFEYREAIIKSIENDELMGQYGYNSNCKENEAARLRERSRNLDENESAAKERYESLNCQETTGLSADAYRHQVIEAFSNRKMEELRERKKAEIAASMQKTNDNSNQL